MTTKNLMGDSIANRLTELYAGRLEMVCQGCNRWLPVTATSSTLPIILDNSGRWLCRHCRKTEE